MGDAPFRYDVLYVQIRVGGGSKIGDISHGKTHENNIGSDTLKQNSEKYKF